MRTLDVRWRAVRHSTRAGRAARAEWLRIGLANGVGRLVGSGKRTSPAPSPRSSARAARGRGSNGSRRSVAILASLVRHGRRRQSTRNVAIDCGALFEKTIRGSAPAGPGSATCTRSMRPRAEETDRYGGSSRTSGARGRSTSSCRLVTECPQAHSLGDGEERRSSDAGPRGRIFQGGRPERGQVAAEQVLEPLVLRDALARQPLPAAGTALAAALAGAAIASGAGSRSEPGALLGPLRVDLLGRRSPARRPGGRRRRRSRRGVAHS